MKESTDHPNSNATKGMATAAAAASICVHDLYDLCFVVSNGIRMSLSQSYHHGPLIFWHLMCDFYFHRWLEQPAKSQRGLN